LELVLHRQHASCIEHLMEFEGHTLIDLICSKEWCTTIASKECWHSLNHVI